MGAVTVWRWLHGRLAVIGFAVLVAGVVAAFAQLETLRHDQCETSRTDTQAAIVAGMEAAGVRPETRRTVADAVAEALPVDEC